MGGLGGVKGQGIYEQVGTTRGEEGGDGGGEETGGAEERFVGFLIVGGLAF